MNLAISQVPVTNAALFQGDGPSVVTADCFFEQTRIGEFSGHDVHGRALPKPGYSNRYPGIVTLHVPNEGLCIDVYLGDPGRPVEVNGRYVGTMADKCERACKEASRSGIWHITVKGYGIVATLDYADAYALGLVDFPDKYPPRIGESVPDDTPQVPEKFADLPRDLRATIAAELEFEESESESEESESDKDV